MHFPKNTHEIPDSFLNSSQDICAQLYPRNTAVRATTERQTRQIAKALSSSPYLRKRIRAIDEARHFLELRRGDRLGHALALGTIRTATISSSICV